MSYLKYKNGYILNIPVWTETKNYSNGNEQLPIILNLTYKILNSKIRCTHPHKKKITNRGNLNTIVSQCQKENIVGTYAEIHKG